MSDFINKVSSGELSAANKNTTKSTVGTNSLGKDAFLQLLVTQMKYQDPLNPNTDTAFVAQLATFSQLEQMQNLSQTSSNSQAFSLVGMNVSVKSEDSNGSVSVKTGVVDYVTMKNGKAQLNIDGNFYSIDQLDTVLDTSFVIEQGLPYLVGTVEETFDAKEPKDITFNVNFGSQDTVATDVAIIINNKVIDAKHVSISGTKVTISKEALSELKDGVYNPTLVFNDPLYTTVSGKVKITITNSTVETEPEAPEESEEETDANTVS